MEHLFRLNCIAINVWNAKIKNNVRNQYFRIRTILYMVNKIHSHKQNLILLSNLLVVSTSTHLSICFAYIQLNSGNLLTENCFDWLLLMLKNHNVSNDWINSTWNACIIIVTIVASRLIESVWISKTYFKCSRFVYGHHHQRPNGTHFENCYRHVPKLMFDHILCPKNGYFTFNTYDVVRCGVVVDPWKIKETKKKQKGSFGCVLSIWLFETLSTLGGRHVFVSGLSFCPECITLFLSGNTTRPHQTWTQHT